VGSEQPAIRVGQKNWILDAPPEAVITMLTQPAKLSFWVDGVIDVTPVSRRAELRREYRLQYENGREGTLTYVRLTNTAVEWIVTDSTGRAKRWRWGVRRGTTGTRVQCLIVPATAASWARPR
jgi:hypothetical protein